MKFESLGLIRPILDALREAGYRRPTPIQEQAIPAALAGRDVLGCARTGTGKTCAFAAPILQRLAAAPAEGRPIRALVLAPTRELAIQDQESFADYGRHLDLKSAVIFGGVGQNPQVEALKSGCDILVATPGRLEDLHNQGFVDVSRLEILVLDEADRMLDMGFIHDVKKILAWLPAKKQTLFFSATMPPEISDLVDSLLCDPVKIAVDPVSSPVDVIDQSVYLVDQGNKTKLLIYLLEEKNLPSALVFTRTKHGANRVAQDLTRAKISAAAIHGNKSQTARQEALAGFKAGNIRVLVATDIAARGLDVEDLACVFNYNLPEVPETYVHRIGRTGRAGKGGTAISFCDYGEKPLLRDIEKLIGHRIPEAEGHPFPMEIFEAPTKDSHGRPVHPENEAARQAAREKKQAAKSAQPAVKQAGPVKAKPVQQPQKAALQADSAAAKSKKQPQSAKKQADPAKENPVRQPAAQESPSAIHLPEQRSYRRPERKPMSALDEIAPALSEDEVPAPLYGAKRTGHLRNTFFTPEEQAAYAGDAEPLTDATSRLLSTHKSAPTRSQEPSRDGKSSEKVKSASGKSSASSGKSAAAQNGAGVKKSSGGKSKAAPTGPSKSVGAGSAVGEKAKAAPAGRTASAEKSKSAAAEKASAPRQSQGNTGSQNRKKKKSGSSHPAPKPAEPQGTPAASARLLTPSPKKGKRRRGPDRPMPDQRSIYGAHKRDSTEQSSSLIRPYYLSDDQ